jgi:gliding motility-associated-like protein
MNKRIRLILLIVFGVLSNFIVAQPCTNVNGTGATPTKCFEIMSILVDACDGSNEGKNEMIRLKIGPNPILVSTFAPGPCVPGTTVNWGVGSSNNPFFGWANLNPSTLTKVDTINKRIKAKGNCGILIPKNKTDYIPASANLLIITSTAFNPTAQDFSTLQDTLYVIFQAADPADNQGGHFANYNFSPSTRKLILYSGTCGDTVVYDISKLLNQNLVKGPGDGATVNYTFVGAATYTNPGCKVPIPIHVLDAGTALPNYCSGSTVNLNGTYSGNNCFYWKVNNNLAGRFADSLNLSTSFKVANNFIGKCKLYLVAKQNCAEFIDSVVFDVFSSIGTLSISSTDTVWCKNSLLQIAANSSTANPVLWTTSAKGKFIDSISLNAIYQPHKVLDNGLYWFKVSQSNSCGAIADSIRIRIFGPNASFNPDKFSVCKGDLPFGLNPVQNNGTFSGATNLQPGNKFNPIDTGNFKIKYLINENGCLDSTIHTILVNAYPSAQFTLSSNEICNDQKLQIVPIQTGGIWKGTPFTGNTFQSADSGWFNFIYIMNNAGCKDSTSQKLHVLKRPNAKFIISDSIFCLNDPSASIQVFQTGGIFSGVKLNLLKFYPDSVGTFNLIYTIQNGICSDSSKVNILVHPKPKADFDYEPLEPISHDPVIFSFTGSDARFYHWDFDNSDTSNLQNPKTVYLAEGTYRTLLTVSNQFGCQDTLSKSYKVFDQPSLTIPNVFSPNNDLLNEYFYAKSVGIKAYKMEIYNRWGQLIFETNDAAEIKGWDGNYNGTTCAEGVYYYHIYAKGVNGKEFNYRGSVTLVR